MVNSSHPSPWADTEMGASPIMGMESCMNWPWAGLASVSTRKVHSWRLSFFTLKISQA